MAIGKSQQYIMVLPDEGTTSRPAPDTMMSSNISNNVCHSVFLLHSILLPYLKVKIPGQHQHLQ